jgi:hypothetical protein
MFSVLVAVAVLFGGASANADLPKASSVLHPFTSDGCSTWPDGWPGGDDDQWRHCCVLHDLRYYAGGTRSERFAADNELRRCVGKSGQTLADKIMAVVIQTGVAVGGEPGLPTTWRWGYGWKYDRGYAPLTPEERALADSMLPHNPLSFRINAKEGLKLRPGQTEDRCEDLVRSEFSRIIGNPLKISRSQKVAGRYTVISSACIGTTTFDVAGKCTRADNGPIRIERVSATGICVVPEELRN